MERLLKMKKKNTVFVDKAIDGQRLEGKVSAGKCGQCLRCLKCSLTGGRNLVSQENLY